MYLGILSKLTTHSTPTRSGSTDLPCPRHDSAINDEVSMLRTDTTARRKNLNSDKRRDSSHFCAGPKLASQQCICIRAIRSRLSTYLEKDLWYLHRHWKLYIEQEATKPIQQQIFQEKK
jgi:hypothetical protein